MRTHVPPGEALVQQLKWVHDMIRRDLATVRKLAKEVTAGLPGETVRQRVGALQANGPLWQLRVNCLRHCSFVHGHHTHESAEMFPRLRRSNPALGPVIDKLQADHEHVSDLLDEVEGACRALSDDDSAPARQRVADALEQLAKDLLEHLDYEEEQVAPTLRTWNGWHGR